MPQETELSEGAVQALSSAGIKEGANIGGSVLTPEGTFRPTAFSSADGVKTVEKALADTNKVAETAKSETTPTETKPKPTPEEQIMQSEADATKTDAQKAREDIESRADAAETSLHAMLDPIKAQMDQQRQAQVSGIYSQFTVLRNQLMESNRRREQAQQAIQLRKGGQYAPTVMAAQVEGVVQQGVQKLAELNAQENNAIAQINNAHQQGLLSLAMKEYDGLTDIRANKDKALADLDKEMAALSKKITEENKILENQLKISDAFDGGLKTNEDVFNYLQKVGSPVTAKEISDYITNVRPKEPEKKATDRFTNDDTLKLLGAGIDAASQQFVFDEVQKMGWPQFRDKYKGQLTATEMKALDDIYIPKDKKTKNAADTDPKSLDYIDYEITALNKIPIQVRNSVAESDYYKGVIKQYYDKGVPASKLGDLLSGFRIDKESPFAAGMRDNFKLLDDEWKQSDTANLAVLINSGREDLATQKFETHLMNVAKNNIGTDFVSEAATRYAVQKTDEIKNFFNDLGFYSTGGPVAGTINDFFGRFGSVRARELKAKFTNLTANLQKERAGTAMTDNEWQRIIEPSIPQLTDKASVVQSKLKELAGNGIITLNSQRNSVGLPSVDHDSLLDIKRRAKLYYQTSPLGSTQTEAPTSVTVGGKDVQVGSVITTKSGRKGKVNADGTITPIQ